MTSPASLELEKFALTATGTIPSGISKPLGRFPIIFQTRHKGILLHGLSHIQYIITYNMIKKLFLGLVLFAVIALVAIYFIGSSLLNKGIKSGVETFGPHVTQTSVTLESANISVLSGSGTLKGLNIGNPEGFENESIFALGQIDLKVDTGFLNSNQIIIDHIIIKKPVIRYEKTLNNSNVKELMKNIAEFTGSKDISEPKPETDDAPALRVVIKKLVIEEGKIFVGVMGVGRTVSLPRIEMNDIGEDGSQMNMEDALDTILATVLKNIGDAISNAGELGGTVVDTLKAQGLEKADQLVLEAGDAAGDAINKVTDDLQGLFK